MALVPFRNHWWHVTLYVSARGLTTGPMPCGDATVEVELDFVDHRLRVRTSDGRAAGLPAARPACRARASTTTSFAALAEVGVDARDQPASRSTSATARRSPTTRCTTATTRTRSSAAGGSCAAPTHVLARFASRFNGKASPTHLFWHGFDLAHARFSGRRAPPIEGADPVTAEAYSHEVIAFGWWPGDDRLDAFPAFYSYTAPEPDGLRDQPLEPAGARVAGHRQRLARDPALRRRPRGRRPGRRAARVLRERLPRGRRRRRLGRRRVRDRPLMTAGLEPPVEAYLAELVARLRGALGERFTGAWLFGSAAAGDFDPARSDLDVQAVSEVALALGEREHLAAALSHEALPCPVRGLELGALRPSRAADPAGPLAVPAQQGPRMDRHVAFDPADEDPRFWFVLDVAIGREAGRPLAGPAAAEVFPPPPRPLVLASLREALAWFHGNDPVGAQAVLAACRAWAWAAAGPLADEGRRRTLGRRAAGRPGSGPRCARPPRRRHAAAARGRRVAAIMALVAPALAGPAS